MTTGSNNIFLGADTRTLTGNISNTLNIGNTLFANNIPTTYTGSAGYVGIGTRAPNQQLELTQSMRLPTTTSNTTGVIYKDGNRFIHNYEGGTNPGTSTFLGLNAGNFTLTSAAVGNTGIGRDTLMSLTTGAYNTALGKSALQSNTGASYNTAI